MNERINELIKQSYVTVRSQNDRDVTYFSQEKFAELIVAECVGVVEDAVNHREPASTYVGKIREHFGVE